MKHIQKITRKNKKFCTKTPKILSLKIQKKSLKKEINMKSTCSKDTKNLVRKTHKKSLRKTKNWHKHTKISRNIQGEKIAR